MLLGRGAELKQLNRFYEQDENSLVIVYGQKGVGVQAFLEEFSSDKNVIHFFARSGSEREQLYLWANELRSQGLAINAYPDFSVLFSTLHFTGQKQVLWIQDFQNLIKNSNQFMEQLLSFFMNSWNPKHTMIILSSSNIGWVENAMIGKIGKSAKEISGFLKLRPLNFVDFVCYFDQWSTKSCIEAYGLLGGIPQYWKHFDKSLSLEDNISKNILEKNSFFYNEGAQYLFRELREDNVYNTILATLASGKNKLNSLYLHTEYSRAKISVYLKNLMQLEIVEKVYSYETGGFENTQKGIYRICHPYLNFFYRYLYPNLSFFGNLSGDEFYHLFLEENLPNFYGNGFRQVCMEYLTILNQRKMLPFTFTKSGEWIGKTGSIDIIVQSDSLETLCGLCNYEKNCMSYEDYEWFLFCIKEAKLKADYLYLFSLGGFDDELQKISKEEKNLKLIDINQL